MYSVKEKYSISQAVESKIRTTAKLLAMTSPENAWKYYANNYTEDINDTLSFMYRNSSLYNCFITLYKEQHTLCKLNQMEGHDL
jgi:acetone carboxylase gamma subunit